MFDKVLIWGGILLGSILIIENIVNSAGAYLFLDYTNTWTVVFVSVLIWVAMWFWFKWFMNRETTTNEEENDYNF